MLECLLVLVGPDHPPVREGNGGEIETGFRRVHDTRLSGQGEVAAENSVRAALGQLTVQCLQFRCHG